MKYAKTVFKWLMYAAVVASIVFFVRAFMIHMEKLPPIPLNLATVAIGLLSMVSVVVTHFFGTHVWRLLMSDRKADQWKDASHEVDLWIRSIRMLRGEGVPTSSLG